jgi:WD40 repeat protein/DNA-binding SARP family transcriptional activator
VLAALVIKAGSPLTVEQLAVALWGDQVPPSATKVVQGAVMRLRRVVGQAPIETTAAGYRLVPELVDVDVTEFEGLVAQGRQRLALGDGGAAIASYEQALSLWRGAPLPELQDWDEGRAEAARLVEVRESAEEEYVESLLMSGRMNDAVADARRLASRAVYREHRWALYALALYRTGRQREALEVLRRARTTMREELGLDPGQELADLESAILRQDPALTEAPAIGQPSAVCPYPGLRAFDVDHAELFSGREAEIDDCLARLDDFGFLLVAGASGSGKSSLVRAGLVTALRAGGREVVLVTPGAAPEANLTATLAAGPENAILVVDQLEEAFASAGTPDIAPFLSRLSGLVESGRTVVATVRADYLASLSYDPAFARQAERALLLLAPMTEESLRLAIEEPARRSGLRLEQGLVDLLVRDVLGEAGGLPLLSHALAETWARREGALLTVEGYRATGGIYGAVAQSAERLYESLPASDRESLRSVMHRLVTPAPTGDPVAARVPTRVFSGTTDAPRVLDLLVRARLVTTYADTAAIAHESLVRAWPRLRSWLDEDVEGQRTLAHLQVAADAWDRAGRPPDELYRGARLQTALEWRDRSHPVLAQSERDFLDGSVAHEQDEQRARARQLQAQTRTNRQLRFALVGVVVLLAASLVGGSLAAVNGQRAQESAESARASATESRAGRLAFASQSEPRLDTSLLLARQAVSMSSRPSLHGNLLAALVGRSVLSSVRTPITVPPRTRDSTFSADGTRALVEGESSSPGRPLNLYLLDTSDGEVITGLPLASSRHDPGHWPWVAGFLEGGRVAAVMRDAATSPNEEREIALFDAETGADHAPARLVPGSVSGDFFRQDRLTITPDGRTLTSVLDRTLRIWRRTTSGWAGPRQVPLPAFPPSITGEDIPAATRFSTDGRVVAIMMEYQGPSPVSPPHVAFVLDLATGRSLSPTVKNPADIALSPDGRTLAAALQTGDVILQPVGAGTGVTVRIPTGSNPNAVAFSGDGKRLAVGYDDGGVAVYQVNPLREVLRIPQTGVPARFVSLPSDGRRVLTVDDEGRITAYSLEGASSIMATATTAPVDHLSAGPKGTIVAAGFHDGRVAVFDQRTLARQRDLWLGPYPEPDGTFDPPLHRRVTALAVTPDGTAVIAADRVGHLRMWSVADGRVLWARDDVPASWIAVSPDGRYLATSEFTQDANDEQEAVHPDSSPVATAVRVWDLTHRDSPVFTDSLEEFLDFDGHTPKPQVITFSPDSSKLAAAWSGDLVLVYDVRTGKRILTQSFDLDNAFSVASLTFTPDSNRLLVHRNTGEVFATELRTGRTARVTQTSTTAGYSALAYSGDGQLLFAFPGTTESVLSIWDAQTYAPVVTDLTFATTDGGGALAPTEDGHLFIGTANGIQRLDLDLEHWKTAACALAGRPLTRQEWASYLPGTPYQPAC